MGFAAVIVAAAVIWTGVTSRSGESGPSAGERKVPSPPVIEEFALPNPGGQKVELSSLTRGRPFAISFGTLDCPSCRHQMAVFQSLTQKYGDRVAFIEVFVGEPSNRVNAHLSEQPLDYPVLLDPKGEVFFRYGSRAVPVTLVGDRDAQMLAHTQGAIPANQLVGLLDRALQEPNTSESGKTVAVSDKGSLANAAKN